MARDLFELKVNAKTDESRKLYKMVMALMHGVVLERTDRPKRVWKTDDEIESYLEYNKRQIDSYYRSKKHGVWKVNLIKPLNSKFNLSLLGVMIRSHARTQMFELFETGPKVSYCHTDSIQINESDVEAFADMIGVEMGMLKRAV
jgi:hypothetical protein